MSSNLNYIQATEPMAGAGGAFTDTLNRALRNVLALSGYNPDATIFPGMAGPAFNIVAFGAPTNGTSDTSPALLAAATAAGTTGRITIPPGTYAVNTNTAISCAVTMEPGAILKPATGVTITLNGPFTAPMSKVFDTSASATAKIVFGTLVGGRAVPQWWGAKADYNTDDAPAIQSAMDAVETARGVVYFPNGHYRIATSLKWMSFITLQGESENGAVIDCQVVPLAAPLIVAKYPTQPVIYAAIRDLTLRGGTYGVDFGFGVGGYATNLTFDHVGFSIHTVGGLRCNAEFDTSEFRTCTFDTCVSGVTTTAGVTNHNHFFNTEFASLTGKSIDFQASAEVNNFIGCRFEGSNGAALGGITINLNNARNINFRGCYFESHRQTLLNETNSANGVSFDGCHFTGASDGAGGFTDPLIVSNGIVHFGSNSGFTAMTGPAKAMVMGVQNDAVGAWMFGAQSQKMYYSRTKQRQHFVSNTPTIVAQKDLLIFTRDNGSDGALTNQQKISGRLRINALGVTSGGFDYQYSREYQVTISAIGVGTMGATITQLGAGMDVLRGSTLTVQQKAGATSTSLTIEAAFTALGTFVGSEMQWEWEGISSSSHAARYIGAELP